MLTDLKEDELQKTNTLFPGINIQSPCKASLIQALSNKRFLISLGSGKTTKKGDKGTHRFCKRSVCVLPERGKKEGRQTASFAGRSVVCSPNHWTLRHVCPFGQSDDLLPWRTKGLTGNIYNRVKYCIWQGIKGTWNSFNNPCLLVSNHLHFVAIKRWGPMGSISKFSNP